MRRHDFKIQLFVSEVVTPDLVIVGDLSRRGDCGFRIRSDLDVWVQAGYRVALIHAPSTADSRSPILPDIALILREGLADLVPPGTEVAA
jgi:hypothetical protein